MAELRWILLLAGVVFLCALATWELRRAQRERRAAGSAVDELIAERSTAAAHVGTGSTRRREPTLDLSFESDGDDSRQDGASHPLLPAPSPQPTRASARHDPDAPEAMDAMTAAEAGEPTRSAPEASATSGADACAPETDPELADSAPRPEHSEHSGPAIAASGAPPIEASPPLRVEWPDERERRILSVRIVASGGERLSGRAVRQALGACGFLHGPYRIYHQPGADGRALLSCANLTKPGDFDALTLDFQRLTGLSLFALLPGPMPPCTALEHLLATADELAQRLHAKLADERGAPLDQGRIAALRAMVQQWMEQGEPQSPGRPGANGRTGAERAREA